MNAVFEHIAKRTAEFSQEPLFGFLRSSAIDAAERLRFVPWAAHAVMTFNDLYKCFLPCEQPQNRYDEWVNANLVEEAAHGHWFLGDLTAMGMDPTMRFTDALRFLWSDATTKTRRLTYDICRLSAGLDSLQRLVLVHSIEATSRVTFEAFVPPAAELEARWGRRLAYFGPRHLAAECEHTLEDAVVRKLIAETLLDDGAREGLLQVVDTVFLSFRGFAHDLFRIARDNPCVETHGP